MAESYRTTLRHLAKIGANSYKQRARCLTPKATSEETTTTKMASWRLCQCATGQLTKRERRSASKYKLLFAHDAPLTGNTIRLDLIIMPLLTLGFFCLQLDRGNIANAITDRFREDIGITQNQFNVGQQMLSLGIVLFEIPANMALYRVGPGKWLTLQLFLFGTVSTFQAFQTNYASFIATRFLLGITESGFIPGGLWTLSTWYTRSETAKRVMIFYFGNQFGQASAKLLAYGILHMRGVGDKSGWFWLFALMGGFTIVCGFILGFFLPDSFKRPHPSFLPKWQMFTDREIHILRNRVHIDDPAKSRKKKRIGLVAFKKAFSNWRMWAHFTITMCNNGPQRAFDTYAPSLVREFGFGALRANAMAAVGLFIQIPVSFGFSWFSDHLYVSCSLARLHDESVR